MRPTTTPSRRWRWRPQGLRRLPPPCRASRRDAIHCWPSLAIPDAFGPPQNKGRQIALPPCQSRENELLQVSHRGQVSRELDNAGCAAPVGAEGSGCMGAAVDGREEARAAVGGAVIAGEGV